MDNGQERWDKLVHMPDECEYNPDIAQRAIDEILKRESEPKKSWFARKWKALVASVATVAVALCIAIPVVIHFATPPVVYNQRYDVSYEEIENADTYIAENYLNVLYFDSAFKIKTQVALIKDTNELGFISQETWHMGDGFPDKVILYSIVKKNAEFEFTDAFQTLTQQHVVQNITVKYQTYERDDTQDRQVLAKFTYQEKEYYLDIITELEAETQLETYIQMLIG